MKRIVIDEFKVDNIPVLSIYPSEVEKLPLIFYIHGYSTGKGDGLELG